MQGLEESLSEDREMDEEPAIETMEESRQIERLCKENEVL